MPNHYTCQAAGCHALVRSRYSPWCQMHRRALARHGHPLQRALKAADLAPFSRLIAKRQADNRDSAAWTILRGRWSRMVEHSQALLAHHQTGVAMSRWEVAAARLLVDLSEHAEADAVIRSAMAVVMLSVADARHFASDRAVVFTVARQVLKLAPRQAGHYWDHKTQKARTVARDVAPKVLELVGRQLCEAFAGAAGQLYAIEQTRVPPEEAERRALTEALQGLKG